MTDKPKKKGKLIREQVKDRHTSHWDLDYLSREELEQLMTKGKPTGSADKDAGAESEEADADDEGKQ